ncbi:hypothetical protein [Marinomonas sp. GJ51-6]|uniref:hypothetical protein n=1 Tax=Marinomonas sp. GJ51-6 TaxID=2992802 RepID=UPI0029350CD3|nr:hypothetical protein [Marinomonas sp. GJ51-6]WOD07467.1 hypothetical protein ONZ50_18220 [Marinomonas sp. GJ51-6]
MKFSDLMHLSADDAGNILIDDLVVKLPNTPLDVIEQFYADHGRNYGFQEQYADIDISNLEWTLVGLSYSEIAEASIFSNFKDWSDTCTLKSQGVASENDWSLIGHNKSTVQNWEENRTWVRPPIMLITSNNYHLVEGHSRFGCLKGLVLSGIISPQKSHQIWLAKIESKIA